MIRLFIVATIAALTLPFIPLCHAAYSAEPEIVDGIAAVVNGDIITFSQVRVLVAPREKLLRSQYRGEELVAKIKEAREAALKDLIDRQLIIQAFKKESFQIPDHYVDERMHEIIKESFGGDRNTFIKTLEAQNYSLGEFKRIETERMIVQAMRSKNVRRDMIAPPAKIEEYYKAHHDEFTNKEQIKLRLIMIPAHSGDGNAPAQKAMAEEILTKLANGAEFDRMAQIYSEDTSRDLGGDWGWIDRKTLAGPLEKVAFNLGTGKISNIVEFSGNYYIMKVEDRRGGETKTLAQVHDEIEKKILQQQAQDLQERWLASLRSKAYIKTF